MIRPEPVTIEGRPGVIVFLDKDRQPVEPSDPAAVVARAVFDDGGSATYQVQPSRHDLYSPDQSRDERGRFAEENARVYAQLATQEQLNKLIKGRSKIEHPDENLINAGQQVATVLQEMKAKGMEMPHHVIIDYAESGQVGAQVAGTTIEESGHKTVQKDLTVHIPKTLPKGANLDDAVAAVFGKPSLVSPKHAYSDSEYAQYDRFAARTMRDVITHEMGHVQAGHRGITPGQGVFPMADLLTRHGFSGVGAVRRAAMRVSEYALSNQDEFLAEGFTRLSRGEKLADDSQKLYDALDGPPPDGNWDKVFFPRPS
jgi:hypothetical protein